MGSEGACSFLNCLLSCLQAEKEAVQREAMDLVVPSEQHFPNRENKRTVQEANVESMARAKIATEAWAEKAVEMRPWGRMGLEW